MKLSFLSFRQQGVKPLFTGAGVLLAAAGLSACETAKRLAPPGIYKYEERANGIPTSPDIEARINARAQAQETDPDQRPAFPKLSEVPSTVPDGLDDRTRAQAAQTLSAARIEAQTALKEARSAVAAEFNLDENGLPLAERADDAELEDRVRALEEGIARDQANVASESEEALPDPLPTPEAPKPVEPF
ncbi:MAG: hypothetical protein AAGL18_05260 [Pseudomonadota bacterium]